MSKERVRKIGAPDGDSLYAHIPCMTMNATFVKEWLKVHYAVVPPAIAIGVDYNHKCAFCSKY